MSRPKRVLWASCVATQGSLEATARSEKSCSQRNAFAGFWLVI